MRRVDVVCSYVGHMFVGEETLCFRCGVSKDGAAGVPENRVPSCNMTVMQPTVTNKSEPVDLNYLYLVLSKREKEGFDYPGISVLTQKVMKLGEAFITDQDPGSGFYAKAEVDLIIVDILERVLSMFIQRGISMETAFKHITFPKGIITTVGEMDKEAFKKAWSEPGIIYIDSKHAKSVTCVPVEYPLRPEESDPIENIIE